jgi:hypothetical protein
VPHQTQILLIAGSAACLGVIFAVAMEDIHPLPDKLTRQKDATELAGIQAQAPVGGTELRASPPATTSNAGIDRSPAEPKELSQAKTREAKLVDGRIRSVSPKTDSPSKRQLKAWKEYRDRQTEKELQREQAMAVRRQRYAQQGSLFDAISRALGFRTQ